MGIQKKKKVRKRGVAEIDVFPFFNAFNTSFKTLKFDNHLYILSFDPIYVFFVKQ